MQPSNAASVQGEDAEQLGRRTATTGFATAATYARDGYDIGFGTRVRLSTSDALMKRLNQAAMQSVQLLDKPSKRYGSSPFI